MGLFDKIKTKKPDAGEGKTTEIFEDAFSAIQADMVQICLEYVDNRADKIFIYASFEENTILQSAGSNRRFCGAKRTRCGASGLNL